MRRIPPPSVPLLLALAAILLCLLPSPAWGFCDSSRETYAIFQCADRGYFQPPPTGYTIGDVTGVFWQLGFGNNLVNQADSSTGTGMSGKSTFSGNDSGLVAVDLRDAHSLDSSLPEGSICLGSNDWSNSGVDGCCDNPRADTFWHGGYIYQGDDDILNPYFSTYLDGAGYPGYYSLASVVDYPTAVLLKTSDDRYFAVAAVTGMDRGNDGTGLNGPCAAAPGTNPGPCDRRQGYYAFSDVTDGSANAIDPNRNNVIPWQETPAPAIDSNTPVDPNDPNSDVAVDVSWPGVAFNSDGSVRPSTNPTMGPANPDAAAGVGVANIASKFGLERYLLEAAAEDDPNFTATTHTVECPGGAECSSPTSASLVVPADSCFRVTTLFGTKPRTSSPATADCRVGKCGDIGYGVTSYRVCLSGTTGQGATGGGGSASATDPNSGSEEPSTGSGPPPAQTQYQKVEQQVYDRVASVGSAIVHIVLEGGRDLEARATEADLDAYSADVKAVQDSFIDTLPKSGVSIAYRYKFAFGLMVYIDTDGLAALEDNPDVKRVYAPRTLRPTLAEGIPLIGADVLHNDGIVSDPNKGAIAVVDTGIDWQHIALGGCFGPGCRVEGGADCTATGSCTETDPNCVTLRCCQETPVECADTPACVSFGCCAQPVCVAGTGTNTMDNDTNGHGTAVAGIAAAHAGSSGGFSFTREGVAPQASLVTVKIYDQLGDSSTVLLDPALEWIMDHLLAFGGGNDGYGIRTVTISAANGPINTDPNGCDVDPNGSPTSNTAMLIHNLTNLPVAVVVGSGNNGSKLGVSWPACIPDSVAVAASYDADFGVEDPNCAGFPGNPADPNTVWCGSNTGKQLDLVAPGPNTDTTGLTGGTDLDAVHLGFSGTSAATPYVAGAFALAFSQCRAIRLPSVNTIVKRLQESGVDVKHKDKSTPYKRIDLEEAMRPVYDPADFGFADLNNPDVLSWKAMTGAKTYDLYRGGRSSSGSWTFNPTCLAPGWLGTSYTDTEEPAPGELFYYLATGQGCFLQSGAGTWSDGSGEQPRTLPSPCP